MFLYTVIASENDAVHLSGHMEILPSGKLRYTKCLITFWEVTYESYRTEDSRIKFVWDNEGYFVGELYEELEKFCDIHKFTEFELDEGIEEALALSGIDPYELRDMIRKAMDIGILEKPEIDPFDEINKLLG